ncbi:thioredoxin [Baekduia sp. Peel2402]|uniref:thioredoxin n=1 Tax=Baekduia sp. Peel2402 TaxID=3458296 RepID=UPI00403EA877
MPAARDALEAAPAAAWLDGPVSLGGGVVLVDFWTYSCVNWLRTLPYLAAWHARYEELVVIGAHAPEFGFEHDLANVRRAVAELGVEYPVVIDNDFAIWRSFDNHYWPAAYLLDGRGDLVFRHFGEGAYAETERAIQAALGLDEPLSADAIVADGLTLAADWDALRSPETYVGAARGERRTTDTPGDLALNTWSLAGDWAIGPESATLRSASGAIAYRFAGRDLNLVLGGPARFTVTVDGAPPGDAAGVDVPPSGEGEITAPRMYQLIRAPGPTMERTVEVTFHDTGATAYVFTFG